MADKLKEIPAKILEWWNKFTTRQKSIIVGAAAVVIFAFAIIMYVMSKPQYVRLITCETTSQASEIIDTLDSAGIAHKEDRCREQPTECGKLGTGFRRICTGCVRFE